MAWQEILLPTDFSELSLRAASCACSLAARYEARLHVVHVVVPSLLPVPGPVVGQCAMIPPTDAMVLEAERRVKWFARQMMGGRAGDVETAVLSGQPGECLVQYVSSRRIDLIVIGTHACGVISRVFRGSLSMSLLEKVACPVLMVPERESAHETDGTITEKGLLEAMV